MNADKNTDGTFTIKKEGMYLISSDRPEIELVDILQSENIGDLFITYLGDNKNE